MVWEAEAVARHDGMARFAEYVDFKGTLWRRHDDLVRMDARSDLGRFIAGDAWWFSEHEPTRWLLQHMATNLSTGRGVLDVSPDRETWRELMRKQTVAKDSTARSSES